MASEVAALLKRPPADYGHRSYIWMIGMLKTQIEKKHAISVSGNTVQRALYEINYRCKRPRYVLAPSRSALATSKSGPQAGL